MKPIIITVKTDKYGDYRYESNVNLEEKVLEITLPNFDVSPKLNFTSIMVIKPWGKNNGKKS
jgi:hypothetical protein